MSPNVSHTAVKVYAFVFIELIRDVTRHLEYYISHVRSQNKTLTTTLRQ